jgi:hypothetical protein
MGTPTNIYTRYHPQLPGHNTGRMQLSGRMPLSLSEANTDPHRSAMAVPSSEMPCMLHIFFNTDLKIVPEIIRGMKIEEWTNAIMTPI